jgi:hypothetical protein
MSMVKRSAMLVAIAGMLVGAERCTAQFENAARWVPDSANCLVLVQAKHIFDSALSKQEKWKQDHAKAFQSGAAFLPATTERLVIGSQIDLDTMQPVWKVSVLEGYGTPIDMGNVSTKIGGMIESIAGHNSIVMPNDTYFIEIDEHTLLARTPANRQDVVRWLNSNENLAVTLSPYLGRGLNYADKNADVIIALDLEGMLHADTIAQKLKMGGFASDADLQPVAEAIATVQGIMLGITVNDKITGSLRVDLTGNTSVLKPHAQNLLIEILSRRGIMIDDLKNWALTVNSDNFTLSGPLSDTGFRNVLSLVRHSIQHDLVTQSPGEENTGETDVGTRSKQYFAQLQSITNELQGKSRVDVALNTYATWFERYAREIDEMSVINVDPDLVKFGTYLSDNFRDVSGVLRNAQFTKRSTQAGMGDSYYAERYGAWGSYSYFYDNSAARRAVATRQNVEGESAAREILGDVVKQMGVVRRELSQKYQIDF